MTAHEFQIPITSLDAAGKAYEFTVRPAWVRGALEGLDATPSESEGAVELRASKSGNNVVIQGTLRADLQVPCARCLSPTVVHIEKPLVALMVPASAGAAASSTSRSRRDPHHHEYEFSDEEADTLVYDGETVVLDDLIRDELVLEIPMIPLCSEDCPGMSPTAESQNGKTSYGVPEAPDGHAQGAIDPRLLPLKKFQKKKE